jgi:hypothetical protein
MQTYRSIYTICIYLYLAKNQTYTACTTLKYVFIQYKKKYIYIPYAIITRNKDYEYVEKENNVKI